MPDLTITYTDEPAGAREATTPSAEGLEDFCDLGDILKTGNRAPQHATFEDGYWILGSDFRLFPDQPKGLTWGLFSKQISNEVGVFAQPITLVLALSGVYSSMGITLEFDPYGPTWCNDLQIQWWRDGSLIHSKDFQPDGWQYACVEEVHNFDMVAITFRQMSAGYRFLKLQAMTYGFTRTFDSEECFNVDLCQDTDLISDTVSVNTLDFTLINRSTINFLFQRRQLLWANYGDELLGVYYISTHDRSGSRYSVHAVDLVGLAEMAGNHRGGIYEGIRAEDLVREILGDSIPWNMDETLKDVLLYGHLKDTGKRENLRQVAFALSALVVTGHRSHIAITRQSNVLQGIFNDFKSYENGSVASGSLVTRVEVTAYSYSLDGASTTIFEDVLEGEEELTFSSPMGNLAITGGTIIESNANFAIIRGTGGLVVLTGQQYTCRQRIYSKNNPLKNANDADNPIAYSNMTLVGPHNVQEILAACYAYQLRQDRIKGKVQTLTERPGDYVEAITEDGETRRGHLLSLDYVPSTKLAADAVILADYEGEDAG